MKNQEQSIDKLEDVLKAQRHKLDQLQESQGYRNTKNLQESKYGTN